MIYDGRILKRCGHHKKQLKKLREKWRTLSNPFYPFCPLIYETFQFSFGTGKKPPTGVKQKSYFFN